MSAPVVSFIAPAAYTLGGVATWLDRVVPDLRALGTDARVVLTAGRHHDAAAYQQAHPAIAPALTVAAATSTRESRIQALATILAEPPRQTVVSVNIPDAVLAVARLREGGRRGGLRAVMSVHGLEPDLFADLATLAPLLDGVICTNALARARAALVPGLDPDRVHYAPYGTATATTGPRARAAGAPLSIGFAGRFERFQKRVQDLEPMLESLAGLGVEARWLIAGDGPERAVVEAMASRHPHRVELLGHVAPEFMADTFHRRCDVLINPSEWETGPIIVWEAMAHHVAVVSSRYTGSGREAALRDGENCLLFEVGDTRGAAASLARMADERLRTRLRNAAHDLIRERYSPKASCTAWAGALDAIADLPPRRGEAPPVPPAGRLDRWLGPTAAERLRRLTPDRYAGATAGDEWPHTFNHVPRDDPDHWQRLRLLDTHV